MSQVKIIEQNPVQGKDAYHSMCAYDDSDKLFGVTVTPQAIKDLERFGCDLNSVTQLSVEWALSEGKKDGEILVTTESPEFSRFSRWLTTKFRMNE